MPPHDRCIVGCCNNDKTYPERMIVKVGKLVFHKLPVNEERKKAWILAVSKRREYFESVALQSQSFALQEVQKNPHMLLMAFLSCSQKNIKNKIDIQLDKSVRSSNSNQKQPFTCVSKNIGVLKNLAIFTGKRLC